MKFRHKSALMMFILGSFVILLLTVTYYFFSRNSAIEHAQNTDINLAKDSAHEINQLLMEKGRVAVTITTAPVLTSALTASNSELANLDDAERHERIDELNAQWMAAGSVADPVVRSALENPAADYLRAQQAAIPGEYGELFVTDRYGVLVAATEKLTTLAHAHKYWWQAGYNEGEGRIFFDDRGYDTSVEGYVLGVVVPIRKGAEIIGMLKCNLNISEALTTAISSPDRNQIDDIKLVRTGGLVVLEEGTEPLSTSIPGTLVDEINTWLSGSLLIRGDGGKELYVYAPVSITRGSDKYAFGGSPTSIDHTRGNADEGWYIIGSVPMAQVTEATRRTVRLLIIVGISFALVMALVALLAGRALAQPITALTEQSLKIGIGNFDAEVDIQSKDELGNLAESFNIMVHNLRETMISRDLLIAEAAEREQAERDLLINNQRWKQAQTVAKIGNWEYNLTTNTIWGSEEAFRIYGIELDPEKNPDQLLPIELVETCIPERERVHQALVDLIQKNKPYNLEYDVIRTINDIRITVNSIAERVTAEDGTLVRISGTIQDITARRQERHRREDLQAQLNQAQKMESVGRLAGGIAHDFNNMLGVILGHTEMALGQVNPDEPLFEGLLEIQSAATRSKDLTQQMLAFARKQTITPLVLDLNETVENMLKMLRRLIGEDIHLAWLPGSGVWPVKLDPSQIDQLLANLCVNARDAIEGVGKVIIETENITFDQAYCDINPGIVPGSYILLAFSDDGCGMDAETQKMIFEPFFTTKDVGTGTGLGLATVYGIVKQNNGFINVYSEPGDGTTFKIYLPRHADEKEQKQTAAPEVPLARGAETILLVEDEPSILKLTTIILESQGYSVLTASSPNEALRKAGEHAGDIHLLLTDVIMPEMNGRKLADELLSTFPDMKRLFMSGYTANVIAHRGVIDEGLNFIRKPFSRHDLLEIVQKTLNKV
ncbi:MAG: response regulator [Spirochaetaceae bacterium]|nr:response regulator [Spirochaetaceae bacterium]